MLSCKEVCRAVASEEVAETSWWRRVQVRLHLLMCQHCQRYAAQLQVIGKVARDLWGTRPVDEDPQALKRLEETILKGVNREAEKK